MFTNGTYMYMCIMYYILYLSYNQFIELLFIHFYRFTMYITCFAICMFEHFFCTYVLTFFKKAMYLLNQMRCSRSRSPIDLFIS